MHLGAVFRRQLPLAREVRADRDGVRTFIETGDTRIKLEIVLEARIDLTGEVDTALGVPVLDVTSRIAEKLLANADRGLDRATRSRDLIDLAFVATHHGLDDLRAGLRVAETACGAAVRRELSAVLQRLSADRVHAADCVRSLGIEDTATLRRGLARLKRLATAS